MKGGWTKTATEAIEYRQTDRQTAMDNGEFLVGSEPLEVFSGYQK